jgi:hypothetical protein
VKEAAMPTLDSVIPAAGVLHLLVASANVFAPRLLDYRGNLARVAPIVRDVFIVQNVYIELVLVGLAGLCFAYPADLAGRSPLGRALAGFLAVFWGLRVVLQLAFYDGATKKRFPVWNTVFLLTYVTLAATFTAAALFPAE